MLFIEVIAVMVVAGLILVGWDWHTGLSILIGALAYLFPYAVAYAFFFGPLPGFERFVSKAMTMKRKEKVAGSFVAAELVKILMTMGILGAAMLWYSHANWPILLLAFGASIIINWGVMLWALQHDTVSS